MSEEFKRIVKNYTGYNYSEIVEQLKEAGFFVRHLPAMAEDNDFIKTSFVYVPVDIQTKKRNQSTESFDIIKLEDWPHFGFKKECVKRMLSAVGGKVISEKSETRTVVYKDAKTGKTEIDPTTGKLRVDTLITARTTVELLTLNGLLQFVGIKEDLTSAYATKKNGQTLTLGKAFANAAKKSMDLGLFDTEEVVKGVVLLRCDYNTQSKNKAVKEAIQEQNMLKYGIFGFKYSQEEKEELEEDHEEPDYDDEAQDVDYDYEQELDNPSKGQDSSCSLPDPSLDVPEQLEMYSKSEQDSDRGHIFGLCKELGFDDALRKEMIKNYYKVDSQTKLSRSQIKDFIGTLEELKKNRKEVKDATEKETNTEKTRRQEQTQSQTENKKEEIILPEAMPPDQLLEPKASGAKTIELKKELYNLFTNEGADAVKEKVNSPEFKLLLKTLQPKNLTLLEQYITTNLLG